MMSRELIDLVGLAAGTMTTVSFFPQLLKTWRHRSAGDLSYAMLFVFAGGVLLWLFYGLQVHAWPIVLANAVTLGLVLLLIGLKWWYGR